MATERPGSPGEDAPGSPASFRAAEAAIEAIDETMRAARQRPADTAEPGDTGGTEEQQVLDSLLLLRQVRERLAGWETGLIETARDRGASWSDLARPLGVASRQAAERRYLRNRPGPAGSTGEQRVQATRDRRAADRTTSAWARRNAGALRGIAGRITALTDLAPAARRPLADLDAALTLDDPAALVEPLRAVRPHLTPDHPALAERLDALTARTDGDDDATAPDPGGADPDAGP
ncbi:type III effector protein [Streptomyces sp. NPDC008150]|uniref:type III effector protein n=1 Tax=Streptomyces sp. NPDC008150 TaxID=3364816 RepID=UPI0036EC747F